MPINSMRTGSVTVVCIGMSIMAGMIGCDVQPSTDQKQSEQQARALEQAHNKIGMPSVTNFSEKRMMKDLYELRDKQFPTHTYIVSEYMGCLVYLGASFGYGLPYSTQYTSPTRLTRYSDGAAWIQVPQAEPNGLFMPSTAEGTWVMMKDPVGDGMKAVYVEPRVIVSPFRMPEAECAGKVVPAPAKAK